VIELRFETHGPPATGVVMKNAASGLFAARLRELLGCEELAPAEVWSNNC